MPVGRSLWSTSMTGLTSAACQSLMDQQHDQHARGPPVSTCLWSFSLLFAFCLSISCLIFFLHEQQLSMRWHFNSTTKSPQHIYLRELIKSLSSRFPLPLLSCPLPIPLFNNQGHGNNCRGRQRAKRGYMFSKSKTVAIRMFTPTSGHKYVIPMCAVDTSLTQVSRRVWFWQFECRFPSELLLCLQAFLAVPVDRLRGDIVRSSWVTWEHIAKSPFSSYIKKLFIPGAWRLY